MNCKNMARTGTLLAVIAAGLGAAISFSAASASERGPSKVTTALSNEFADDRGAEGCSYCKEIGIRGDIRESCKGATRLLVETANEIQGFKDCTSSAVRDVVSTKCYKRSALVQTAEESGPVVTGFCHHSEEDRHRHRDVRITKCD